MIKVGLTFFRVHKGNKLIKGSKLLFFKTPHQMKNVRLSSILHVGYRFDS